MSPMEEYKRSIQSGRLQPDAAQEKVVRKLQRLYDHLIEAEQNGKPSWFERIRQRLKPDTAETIKGIYLWGPVGRGKTLMVDMFFHDLPLDNKMRMHFHRFMQMIHHELRELQDTTDPITVVADRVAERARIICFDEFHVADITDAMLLGGLFRALFERGVVLVATSNTEPKHLYRDGLQRERFLPAIDLIEKYTHVIHIGGQTDYRLEFLDHAEIYHWPLDDAARECMENNFVHLAPEAGSSGEAIEIEGRDIRTVRNADGVAWFEFEELCGGPRSAADYIEIARTYQAVLVSDIPRLTGDVEDKAKRLINLVDELYDRGVKLIISAAEPPDNLYCGSRHAADFQRTLSRLHEMRSHSYLAGSHRP